VAIGSAQSSASMAFAESVLPQIAGELKIAGDIVMNKN
jgi:hypothetical protein